MKAVSPGDFGKAGGLVFRLDEVTTADFTQIESLIASVTLKDGRTFPVEGIEALELAFVLKPSVVEGRRLRFARHAWLVHNFVGHPLMAVFALMGWYARAFRVHDGTVPKARGAKPSTKP